MKRCHRRPSQAQIRESYEAARQTAQEAVEEMERLAALLPAPVPRRGEMPPMSVLIVPGASGWEEFGARMKSDSALGSTSRWRLIRSVSEHIARLIAEASAASHVLPPYFGVRLRRDLEAAAEHARAQAGYAETTLQAVRVAGAEGVAS